MARRITALPLPRGGMTGVNCRSLVAELSTLRPADNSFINGEKLIMIPANRFPLCLFGASSAALADGFVLDSVRSMPRLK